MAAAKRGNSHNCGRTKEMKSSQSFMAIDIPMGVGLLCCLFWAVPKKWLVALSRPLSIARERTCQGNVRALADICQRGRGGGVGDHVFEGRTPKVRRILTSRRKVLAVSMVRFMNNHVSRITAIFRYRFTYYGNFPHLPTPVAC